MVHISHYIGQEPDSLSYGNWPQRMMGKYHGIPRNILEWCYSENKKFKNQSILRKRSLLLRAVFTPHVCDVSGVIVLTSYVCPSVSLLPLSWPNGQMYRLEFWHGGQVEGYLVQGHRSKVKVTRSKNVQTRFLAFDLDL